ncbi:YigZ family protein [Cytophaga sp. FL35]|uniref:IMPACT family protein n=1 Tax=Cytophaga sp. FL35 TaxID=1904456 RepID=UPI00165367E8|nr:YigZ family protein [Cytophaga sp. FL35]MBC6998699.1 YigZ family protein [Cytophaga sp. FL35]
MEPRSDVFKTVEKASDEILFKEKKSKFYGSVFPINTEDEVKEIIEELRKKHSSAGHVCYAWQIGIKETRYRANDDGEPNNSAGMPIYGQIQSFEVTNVLVAVARIFGGTKLGVGGLISAYKTAAQMALESSKIIEKTLQTQFELTFAYDKMDIVMRTIKQKQLEILSQEMSLDCKTRISVRQSDASATLQIFEGLHQVKIREI